MGWTLDLRSAIAFGALLSLLVDGLLLLSWRSLPLAVRPSLRWWLAGLGLHALGFSLVAARGEIPDWLSIVAANALIATGLGCLAIALRAFYGLPQRRGAHLGLGLGIGCAAAWFTLVAPNLQARIVALTLLLSVPLASGARAVFRHGGPTSLVARLTGYGLLATALVLLARAGIELFLPTSPANVMQARLPNLASVGFLLVLPVLATTGFLLMCTERSNEELERTARLDYLTGIQNRRAIEELAAGAISAARRHGTPLALLLVDVDHFKQFNDRHGHEAGDQALIVTVQRIRAVMRQEDLVGRVGGEEFVVLMPGAELAQAHAAAERLCNSFVERGVEITGHSGGGSNLASATVVTVSVGVAALAPHDAGYAALLGRADRAMYAAKSGGRNRVMSELAGT